MAVDPWIARGVTPIDPSNALADIARLKRSDAIFADESRRRDQATALEQSRWDTQQKQIGDVQEKRHRYGKLLGLLQTGDPVKALLADQEAMGVFRQQGIDPSSIPPDRLAESLRVQAAQLAAELGESIPEAPGPITFERTPWGGQYGLQGGKKVPGLEWNPPAPQREPQYAPPDAVRTWQYRQSLPPEQRAEFDRISGKGGGGGGVTVNPDGTLSVDTSKASEGERVSAGYLGRMRQAEAANQDPALEGYVPSMPSFMAFAALLDDETGITKASIANSALNDTDRMYLGNSLDFILAKMRKESGATIKGGEFRKEYINYFPMPNDSPDVLERKAQKRQTAMRQLEISAGRAEGAADKPAPRSAGGGAPPPGRYAPGTVLTDAKGRSVVLIIGEGGKEIWQPVKP